MTTRGRHGAEQFGIGAGHRPGHDRGRAGLEGIRHGLVVDGAVRGLDDPGVGVGAAVRAAGDADPGEQHQRPTGAATVRVRLIRATTGMIAADSPRHAAISRNEASVDPVLSFSQPIR